MSHFSLPPAPMGACPVGLLASCSGSRAAAAPQRFEDPVPCSVATGTTVVLSSDREGYSPELWYRVSL